MQQAESGAPQSSNDAPGSAANGHSGAAKDSKAAVDSSDAIGGASDDHSRPVEDPKPALASAEGPSDPERSNAVSSATEALKGTAEERTEAPVPAGGVIPEKDRADPTAPPAEPEDSVPPQQGGTGEAGEKPDDLPEDVAMAEESVSVDPTAIPTNDAEASRKRDAADAAAEDENPVTKKVRAETGEDPIGGSSSLKEEVPSLVRQVTESAKPLEPASDNHTNGQHSSS